jgi:glycosyltransferase involved in cell wall biosynthesis
MSTISVIIATRNRPTLFADALGSVLRQSTPPAEIIVVDDGSDEKHRAEYARVLGNSGNRVRSFALMARPRGHGQSYSLNFGVAQATGDYVAFLDDDDSWTDSTHLERAGSVIGASDRPIDLYMSNQAAFVGDEKKLGPIWIEELEGLLRSEGQRPDQSGSYAVSVDDFLRCSGFCHLNALIVRRELYNDIGGMDEGIRWECDRDLVLRLIDRAREVRHSPQFVARHNIPDPTAHSSITTSLSEIERRLYQMRVLDRAILNSAHPSIRAYGRRHKAFTLKKIAEELAKEGRHRDAAFYAREALGAGPTLKWSIYTAYRIFRSLGWDRLGGAGFSGSSRIR